MLEGILVVDKPGGITSHDVVDVARERLGIRRVGHAGTLDPIATGVLVLLIGKATKLFSRFQDFPKEYEATLTLGKTTTTGDIEGKLVEESEYENISQEKAEETFSNFMGNREQIPPMVSAIKHNGRRLYKLAREGVSVPRKARNITIYELKIDKFYLPNIDFYTKCSKGTYIRQLGEDIALELNSGGHISRIRRVGIGPFGIEDAVDLEGINESRIRSWKD